MVLYFFCFRSFPYFLDSVMFRDSRVELHTVEFAFYASFINKTKAK